MWIDAPVRDEDVVKGAAGTIGTEGGKSDTSASYGYVSASGTNARTTTCLRVGVAVRVEVRVEV